jgi:hypothetical protein
MPFKPLMIQGKRGLFQLSDPRPQITRSQASPDRYVDRWSMDYLTDLTEGQLHPSYPGLILRQCAAEEDVPAILTDAGNRPGIYLADCEWEGSISNSKPEKLLGTTENRQIRPGWETFIEQRLSYHAMPKAITGTHSDDIIACPAHGLAAGRAVALVDLTGGAGLTGRSSSAIGSIYYVINPTADALQVSATSGGSAVDFSSNITAGFIVPIEYLPGTPHPTLPQMFLDQVSLKRTADDAWQMADCTYVGQRTTRPYHRIITVNGQTVSSSDAIQVLLGGGWTDFRYTNFSLPRVIVTDTRVTTAVPDTAAFPAFETPPDAPGIMSLVFTGTDFIFNYPYGWTLQAADNIDTLSSGITLNLQRKVYEFVWPALLK